MKESILRVQKNDDYIIALLRNPNHYEQGFTLLMDCYQEQLYWHIRRLVHNHDDANDVIQNTFIKVFRGFHTFEEKSKLYTWLYRIATNEALTFLQKKQQKNTVPLENNTELLNATSYFDGDEIQQLLEKAVAQLPEKQRLVFNMRYYDEMPYEQISEVLGTSVGALKASFHHAVKKIEQVISSRY